MIGRLTGTLVEKASDCLILDVSGVGYEVSVPASSLCQLPGVGQLLSLSIHTHVREDNIRLFGFSTRADRSVFEMLLSVSNVGPKLAMALLGPFEGKELCRVIVEENLAALTSVPGVGAKTAERLMLELRTKAQKLLAMLDGNDSSKSSRGKSMSHPTLSMLAQEQWPKADVIDDLRSALQNLGYKDKQISEVVVPYQKRESSGEELVLEVVLKDALKQLSGHLLGR
ncbi:MAG: Holliday junction branch migration protein RuvA [Silvanigrellaceae bacterium]